MQAWAQAWRGWTAITAPTWEDWCAHQQRIMRGEERQQASSQENIRFNERELARLCFVRWLYQRGRLGPAQTTTSEARQYE